MSASYESSKVTFGVMWEAGSKRLKELAEQGKGARIHHRTDFCKNSYEDIGEWDPSSDTVHGPWGSVGTWSVT